MLSNDGNRNAGLFEIILQSAQVRATYRLRQILCVKSREYSSMKTEGECTVLDTQKTTGKYMTAKRINRGSK